MQRKVKTWLEDIRICIEEINDFVPDNMDYEQFRWYTKTRRAIERNIEIIGEATDRILKVESTIAITDARKIVDARNRIIHGYESVLPDVIWEIVKDKLPLLHYEVIGLLK